MFVPRQKLLIPLLVCGLFFAALVAFILAWLVKANEGNIRYP